MRGIVLDTQLGSITRGRRLAAIRWGGMKSQALLLLYCFVLALPTTQAGGADRILGLVEVPSIFGPYDPNDPWGLENPEAAARLRAENPRRAVELRERASGDSRVVQTVASSDQLESREFAYEALSAVVYARVDGWSQLRTEGGQVGWLAPEDSGPFHPLEELLRDGLTALTEAWDGTLFSMPGGGERQAVPVDWRRTMVGYLRFEDGWRLGRVRVSPEPTRPLFERPDKAARVVANVRLDALESLDNAAAGRIIVFDQRPGWYQVTLDTYDWHGWQRVWIEHDDHWDWTFHPVTASEGRELLAAAWGPDIERRSEE